YQGESNVSRRNEYGALLKTMISNWRDASGDTDMPFYIVELADFLHPSDHEGRAAWAEMRSVQAKVADETPNTTLIRNSDLGEWNDIHPLDKKTLGRRVAYAIIK
ncbi:MAG: sialate O-acetylesterase, partial [Duncaniella sp.]|nr:sialate O-acetylesterase [Duncaniella sp.]